MLHFSWKKNATDNTVVYIKSCCHTISKDKDKYVLSKAVQTQVRLLLMEQPDMGLHCLPIYSKRFTVTKVHQKYI